MLSYKRIMNSATWFLAYASYAWQRFHGINGYHAHYGLFVQALEEKNKTRAKRQTS